MSQTVSMDKYHLSPAPSQSSRGSVGKSIWLEFRRLMFKSWLDLNAFLCHCLALQIKHPSAIITIGCYIVCFSVGVFRIEVSAQAALQDGSVAAEMIIEANVIMGLCVYCIHTCICQLYVHMHCTSYILPIHSWLGIKLVLFLNCRMRQSGLHMKQYLHQTVIPDQVIKSSSLESQGLLFRGHQRGFGPTNLIDFSRMSYTLSKSRNLGQEQVPSCSLMNFSSVSALYSYISLL